MTTNETTYESVKQEIDKAKKDAEDENQRLEDKKMAFIEEQIFTGRELIVMRNSLINAYSLGNDEPQIFRILGKILDERSYK